MPKYILTINVGFGDDSQIIEAESQDAANDSAYSWFREECESQHSYEAEPYTKELAQELGLEETEEEDEGDAA